MKIQIESTDEIVDIATPSGSVSARIWEGTTVSGLPIVAFVAYISARSDADCSELERELNEQLPPTIAGWKDYLGKRAK